MRIAVAVTEMTRRARARIEQVEALVERAGPDAPGGSMSSVRTRIAGERVRVGPDRAGTVGIDRYFAIPALDAAADGREPQVAVRVLGDGPDVVAG